MEYREELLKNVGVKITHYSPWIAALNSQNFLESVVKESSDSTVSWIIDRKGDIALRDRKSLKSTLKTSITVIDKSEKRRLLRKRRKAARAERAKRAAKIIAEYEARRKAIETGEKELKFPEETRPPAPYLTKREQSKLRRKKLCPRCKEKGHKARECPKFSSMINLVILKHIQKSNPNMGQTTSTLSKVGSDQVFMPEPMLKNNEIVLCSGKTQRKRNVQLFCNAQDSVPTSVASTQENHENSPNYFLRSQDRSKAREKILPYVRKEKTPQTLKNIVHQPAREKMNAVSDALTEEFEIPENLHKQFHVKQLKRLNHEPMSQGKLQKKVQNLPLVDDADESEYEIEAILQARTIKESCRSYRQALVKWLGWDEPTWEPIEMISETRALDNFEAKYGLIQFNDGPAKESAKTIFDLAKRKSVQKSKSRKDKKKKPKKSDRSYENS